MTEFTPGEHLDPLITQFDRELTRTPVGHPDRPPMIDILRSLAQVYPGMADLNLDADLSGGTTAESKTKVTVTEPFDPVAEGLPEDHPFMIALAGVTRLATAYGELRHNALPFNPDNPAHYAKIRIIRSSTQRARKSSAEGAILSVLFADDAVAYRLYSFIRRLERNNISTIEQLAEVSPREINMIRGTGPVTGRILLAIHDLAREYMKYQASK